MGIESPAETFEYLRNLELFHMSRLDLIFLILCGELQVRGKTQFYKAAQIAESLEREIQRQERFQ